MRKRITMTALLIVLVVMSFVIASPTYASSTKTTPPVRSFTRACAQAAPGSARCLALVSTTAVQPGSLIPNANHQPPEPGVVPNANPPGSAVPYGPAALHKAYNLPNTSAKAQTVAIVDAFNDPNAESDMATYRSMFGLPACTTANGCFRKVNQAGAASPLPPNDTGWGVEISLDLDMVSATCQTCHILLVEATSATFANLGAAVNEAAALGANEISNSYGASEGAGEASLCSSFYNHPGVAVTASSGDSGLGVDVPAVCSAVTAVGGTTLNTNGTETAWNTAPGEGAGGGCSSMIARPSFEVQSVTRCSRRAVSDVSAVADPNTGVFVEDTFGEAGGLQVGGTSASSPIIASVFALAGGVSGVAASASVPWSKRTSGCLFSVGGATYAFQTGLGSPNGTACF